MKWFFPSIFVCSVFCVYAQKTTNTSVFGKAYERNGNPYNDLTITEGKPVFVVVYIDHGIPNDSLIADRELSELKANFKSLDANFVRMHQNGKLTFDNKWRKTFDFTEFNDSFSKVLFWDGKEASGIMNFPNLVQSSEYFHQMTDRDSLSSSSYVGQFYNRKEEIEGFVKWEPDANSARLSEKLLQKKLTEQFFYLKYWGDFLPGNFKGVKKLTINSNVNGYKNPWHEIYFNVLGQPVSAIIQTDDRDKKKGNITFEYKGNLLAKIKSAFWDQEEKDSVTRVTQYYYAQGRMIANPGYGLTFYDLKDGILTDKNYYFDGNHFTIDEQGVEMTTSGKLTYHDGGLNDYEISYNTQGFFPVEMKYQSDRQRISGKPGMDVFIKLEQTSALNYKIATQEKEKFTLIEYENPERIKKITIVRKDNEKLGKTIELDFNYDY